MKKAGWVGWGQTCAGFANGLAIAPHSCETYRALNGWQRAKPLMASDARVAELADALDSGFHFYGLQKVSKGYSDIDFSAVNKGFPGFLFQAESLHSRTELCRNYCRN
jgi:hypothetical protein